MLNGQRHSDPRSIVFWKLGVDATRIRLKHAIVH
jgi:hypothetical protein